MKCNLLLLPALLLCTLPLNAQSSNTSSLMGDLGMGTQKTSSLTGDLGMGAQKTSHLTGGLGMGAQKTSPLTGDLGMGDQKTSPLTGGLGGISLDEVADPYSTIPLKRPQSAVMDDAIYSKDSTYALDFVNRKRVWRYETRGDYNLRNVKTGEVRQLGKGLPESSLMFAKFSPDGEYVAYVSRNNIYVEQVKTSPLIGGLGMGDQKTSALTGGLGMGDQKTSALTGGLGMGAQKTSPLTGGLGMGAQKTSPLTGGLGGILTTDGCDTIVNGTFDWVYEEEFSCRDGFRWLGDSRHIAYWQSNTSGTGWFDIIDNVDSIYPSVKPFPYPKAGTTNSAVRVGVVSIPTTNVPEASPSVTKWIALPGDPRENYIPRMQVIPGTNTLLIQQMNRAQSHNILWKVGDDLKPVILTEDRDSAWVETNDNIRFLKGNKFFTFYSERDGWRHLYRVSADGKKWTCITNAPMDVVDEVAFDENRGYVYFIATPEDKATERYLYRARIYGNGKVEGPLLLGNREHGQYSYTMNDSKTKMSGGSLLRSLSNGDESMTERFSSAVTPPQYREVILDKKGNWQLGEILEDNHEAAHIADSLGLSKKEFVKVKSGEYMLDAWIVKPWNFDPKKKYPVINYVYGEPASATVQNRWESSLFWQYLASQGFVVVSIENRGANTPRGRRWRKCIYGRIGVQGSEDQKNGILDLCDRFPWMDRDRLGVTGWSGGGSSTLHAMFRYPEVWKTGVAIAPVTDLRLYDTIYEERYMNTPQANPDGYFQGSAINFTEGLKGNLLLIHGTGDDNVHYQNIEMLVNKLVANGKRFYQLSYPMRTHSISERAGTARHLRMQIVDFFKRNL